MPIYSNQVETHVLGGLLKHPHVFPEIDSFVNVGDFYNEVHQSIFCVLRDSVLNGEKVDRVLVGTKIANLGISYKDEIDIFDYLKALTVTAIVPEAVVEACKELVKVRVRREISETTDRMKEYVSKNPNDDLDTIISQADSIYSDKISSYSFNDDPENVFDSLEYEIEERGNNPREDTGLVTPYKEFNRLYGGCRR